MKDEIAATDIFMMSLLKLNYWYIYQDIEQNRDLYTQPNNEDLVQRFSYFLSPDEAKKSSREHFDRLYKDARYDPQTSEYIEGILDQLFPSRKNNTHSEDTLRREHRIGHRDLLDSYFSYSGSQERYETHRGEAERVLKNIESANVKNLHRRFSAFNSYVLTGDANGDAVRILTDLLSERHAKGFDYLMVWRAWLESILQEKDALNEMVNRLLAGCLGGASRYIQQAHLRENSTTAQQNDVIKDEQRFFKNIVQKLGDPYIAILMLLFVTADRGNGFFEAYIRSDGYTHLFAPVLSYVDAYFFDNSRNIFALYPYEGWAFILYQWSLSVGGPESRENPHVADAPVRHRRVNDYVIKSLQQRPQVIYYFYTEQFKNRHDRSYTGEDNRWNINGNLNQYNNQRDITALMDVLDNALIEYRFSNIQTEDLNEIREELAVKLSRMAEE